MRNAFFLVLLVLFSLLYVRVAYPESYLIQDKELQIIEESNRKSETEKQQLQLLVKDLKAQSTELNQLLKIQRATNKKLELSFNELELEQSKKIAKMNELIDKSNSQKNTYKILFIIFLCIGIVEFVFLALFLILYLTKIKR